jgi:hypothetical protein
MGGKKRVKSYSPLRGVGQMMRRQLPCLRTLFDSIMIEKKSTIDFSSFGVFLGR